MVDKKILQWIQKAVDGALSPLERRRLEHHLNRDEEAKRYYQEMMKLSRSLENIHPLEPPEGLRERVIDNINPGSIQVKSIKPEHSKLREFFALRNLRPALAFAAGAAVMLVIVLVMQSVTENGILLPGFEGAIGVH